MAVAPKSRMVYTVDERLLLCRICLDPWLKREPKVLSCQHTYCRNCINHFRGYYTVDCPLCRGSTALPSANVDHLPDHFLAKPLIKFPIEEAEQMRCKVHNEKVIMPPLVCIKCKTKVHCCQCLDEDHSSKTCKIRSYDNLFKDIKLKRQRFIGNLNFNYLYFKGYMTETNDDFKANEQLLKDSVNLKFRCLKKKLDEYSSYKLNILNNLIKRIENVFIDENVEKELAEVKKTTIKLSEKPSLNLEFCLHFKTIDSANIKEGYTVETKKQIFNICQNIEEL